MSNIPHKKSLRLFGIFVLTLSKVTSNYDMLFKWSVYGQQSRKRLKTTKYVKVELTRSKFSSKNRLLILPFVLVKVFLFFC